MKIIYLLLLISSLFLLQDSHAYTVGLDIGHTITNPGATGASGTKELVYNKGVGEAIKEEIEKRKQHHVVLIENMDLLDRVKVANLWADIFISIHHDSVSENMLPLAYNMSGFSIFISDHNPSYKSSLRLGKLVGANLIKSDFHVALYHQGNKKRKYYLVDKANGIYMGNILAVIRETKIPAILLECGVIANMHEEAWLELPENRKKIVMAVADAVDVFFDKWYKKADPPKPEPAPQKRKPINKPKPKQSWISA